MKKKEIQKKEETLSLSLSLIRIWKKNNRKEKKHFHLINIIIKKILAREMSSYFFVKIHKNGLEKLSLFYIFSEIDITKHKRVFF